MSYALYNKSNNVYLTHPKVGLWHTDNLAEAEDMLISCQEYFMNVGWDFLVDQISVVEIKV